MIWMNPWAWLGMLGVALPALIHLLGRGHATPKKFPTLRFIDASRLLPTHRTRIHDPWLLVLRSLIIIAATAALAGPLVLTASRRTSLDRGLARAIIVDTSASMRRRTASGRAALDVARDSARVLASAARMSVIVESATPWTAIDRVSAWIPAQGRRAEVIVLSDFQTGGLARDDLAAIPADAGITLARIAVRDSLSSGRAGDVALVAAADDAPAVAAMRAAVAAVHGTSVERDSTRAVAIVFARAAERSAILAAARPVNTPWMATLLQRLDDAGVSPGRVASATVRGRPSLVLLPAAEPGTLAATELLAATESALDGAASPLERDAGVLSDDSLRAWSRAPSSTAPGGQQRPIGDSGPSDARWLWALALALLGVETLVRRRRAADAAPVEEATARAA